MGLRFLHSGQLGDMLWTLPTIKALGGGELWFNIGTEGTLCRDTDYDFCKPLLERQSYIHGVHKITFPEALSNGLGEKLFCRQDPANPDFLILDNAWYWRKLNLHWIDRYAYTFGTKVDGSILTLEGVEIQNMSWESRPIVSQFTTRYRVRENDRYQGILNQPNVIRIGDQPGERLCIDMLEMATLIRNSKFFIGNQSSGNALAQNLLHPRLIETDHMYPDSYPVGQYGFQMTEDLDGDLANIFAASKLFWSAL